MPKKPKEALYDQMELLGEEIRNLHGEKHDRIHAHKNIRAKVVEKIERDGSDAYKEILRKVRKNTPPVEEFENLALTIKGAVGRSFDEPKTSPIQKTLGFLLKGHFNSAVNQALGKDWTLKNLDTELHKLKADIYTPGFTQKGPNFTR
ncbi:MAG: hypothetical protein V1721_04780 [Pseudomonadota bacterium]